MQRKGQIELGPIITKLSDLLRKASGAHGDAAIAHAQAVLGVDAFGAPHGIRVIQQRLAHAHVNNVGERSLQMLLSQLRDLHHLVHDLTGADQHTLHYMAVPSTEGTFDGPVIALLLLGDNQWSQYSPLGQLGPEILGEVAHRLDGGGMRLPKPFPHLGGAVGLLPQLGNKVDDLLLGKFTKVDGLGDHGAKVAFCEPLKRSQPNK